MSDLAASFDTLLTDICAAVAAGRAPWCNAVARQGPAFLGRSGVSLRGLPAVIAWHAAAAHSDYPLAWRLCHPDTLALPGSTVLPMPAHGGETLYVARPDPRPVLLVDGPTPHPGGELASADLANHYAKLTAGLSPVRIEEDRSAVVSLALAFLRPLGASGGATPYETDGPWDPRRLRRVCLWARVLADRVRALRLRPAGFDAPTRRVRRMPMWSPLSGPDQLATHAPRDAELAGALPAELRELTSPGERHLLPERPLRGDLFAPRRGVRKPGFTNLALWSLRRSPGGGTTIVLDPLHLEPYKRRALAWAEALGLELLPCEVGTLWRHIGRAMRERFAGGGWPRGWEEGPTSLGHPAPWMRFRRHHARSTWLHGRMPLTVEQLARGTRWDHERVREHLRLTPEAARRVQVSTLPLVRVATLRRTRLMMDASETAVRRRVAGELGCDDDWSAVLAAAETAEWTRHARTRRSGRVRWLDVPPPPLRAAQQAVGGLLTTLLPPSGAPTAFHPGASPALHARTHAGAAVAVQVDIADFFGSVRPEHLEPWLGLQSPSRPYEPGVDALLGWSREGRAALLQLVFFRRAGRCYLPQGAPSSPAAANLAATALDRTVIAWAARSLGAGAFSYTRYADDMVLSAPAGAPPDFAARSLDLLERAVRRQGWALQAAKTRQWSATEGEPLLIGGLLVPRDARDPLRLARATERRARAALHRLRHRVDRGGPHGEPVSPAHGMLAYAYASTGDPRWLAYTSRHLRSLAREVAGPVYDEAFLAGWSDTAR